MGMSESHDSEAGDAAHAGHDTTERMTLASLRSQFTSTGTSTLDKRWAPALDSVRKNG